VAGLAVTDFTIFAGDDRRYSEAGSAETAFNIKHNKVRARKRIII
jgi:hypothetical protein